MSGDPSESGLPTSAELAEYLAQLKRWDETIAQGEYEPGRAFVALHRDTAKILVRSEPVMGMLVLRRATSHEVDPVQRALGCPGTADVAEFVFQDVDHELPLEARPLLEHMGEVAFRGMVTRAILGTELPVTTVAGDTALACAQATFAWARVNELSQEKPEHLAEMRAKLLAPFAQTMQKLLVEQPHDVMEALSAIGDTPARRDAMRGLLELDAATRRELGQRHPDLLASLAVVRSFAVAQDGRAPGRGQGRG